MAHHAEKLPWEALASVFELRRTNPCQHGAYNLHARIQPDSKTKLANFVQIFMQSVAEDAAQQRKQYPEKYDVPDENEVIISDEAATKIESTVWRWHPEEYWPDDDDDLNVFKQPTAGKLCPHIDESDKCGCVLPFRERKMSAFQRQQIPNDCYEFDTYNLESFRNVEVVKTLILHGEMDPILRSCAYEGSHLAKWWEHQECQCTSATLGWRRICENGIKMYMILNLLRYFPQTWDENGSPVDDYRKLKAYQQAARWCTESGYKSDIATYPHRDFLGIRKNQFRCYPRPLDVSRWKHVMRFDQFGFERYQKGLTYFDDSDYEPITKSSEKPGIKSGEESDDDSEAESSDDSSDESSAESSAESSGESSDESEEEDPEEVRNRFYKLEFYPYGLMSYEDFLNFEKPMGFQPLPSDIKHVRWILCQQGLPVELSDCILEHADYTPRGRLPVPGKPLHPQCTDELGRYLEHCWQLIVRCYMLGHELRDKMDIEALVREEVKDFVYELFKCECDDGGIATVFSPLLSITRDDDKTEYQHSPFLILTMVALPNEVLHQIFAELEDRLPLERWHMYGAHLDHQGSATLRNLCLVCRQFRHIAQPLLYRTVITEGRDSARTVETLLLRTFVEDPHLGEQVRTVSLTDNADHSAKMDVLGEAARKETIRIYASCAGCRLHYRRPGSPVLLAVEYKDGYEKANEDGGIEDQGISKATFANYCFPNLTDVRIRAVVGEKDIQSAWVIEDLIFNPSLKILRTFGTAWYGEELSCFKWPAHKNYNLEYLDLMETYIDAEGLMTVLTRCPNLTGIAIRLPDEYRKLLDQYETEDSENADCIINLDDFGNVLRKFGQNLEEVDFNTFFYDSYSADYLCRSPISGIIGSLRELKSLRHLKLSKEALIGGSESLLRLSDVLPESIGTLYLHCGKVYELEDWVEFERELYKQEVYKLLLDGMPNLREIRMERYDDWHEFDYCNPEELDYFRSEYIYPKEAEWPAELHVNGWDVDIVEARLYEIRGRPACNRNIITLSRKT
ncbi:hypothetical protein IWW34DRAFT_821601 [Fusarium oxysporum f. sp. albedinis]|nr:hypothetical protein IWW34DRAFT_821601 [Fusarium oxysporum f. sp. albedinis]